MNCYLCCCCFIAITTASSNSPAGPFSVGVEKYQDMVTGKATEDPSLETPNATVHELFLTELMGPEGHFGDILAKEQGVVEAKEIQGRNTG